MNRYGFLTVFFLLLTMFPACSHRQKIQKQITKMNNQYVAMELYNMQRVDPLMSECYDSIHEEFTFVVFTDSNQCSGCSLNKMSSWNTILKLEKLTNGKIKFNFIVEPRSGDELSVLQTAKNIDFVHPLYVDTRHVFRNANAFIPNEPLFHTFLLDKDQKIVLIGNPLLNKKIENLAIKVIEDKIGQINLHYDEDL